MVKDLSDRQVDVEDQLQAAKKIGIDAEGNWR